MPGQPALLIHTKNNVYHLLFGPGQAPFPDGITLAGDGSVSLLRNRDALALAGGTWTSVSAASGERARISLNKTGSAEWDWSQGTDRLGRAAPIQYDTYGGVDHPRDCGDIVAAIEGRLSPE